MKKQGVRYWHEPVGAMVAKSLLVRHNSLDNGGLIDGLGEHCCQLTNKRTQLYQKISLKEAFSWLPRSLI